MNSKVYKNIFLKFIFKILILDIAAIIFGIIFCLITKNLNIEYFSKVISYLGIFLCGLGFISYLGQIEYQRKIAGYGLSKQVKQFRKERLSSKNILFFLENLIAGIIMILLSNLLEAF